MRVFWKDRQVVKLIYGKFNWEVWACDYSNMQELVLCFKAQYEELI